MLLNPALRIKDYDDDDGNEDRLERRMEGSSDLEVEYGGGGGVEVLDIAQIGALFSPSWDHNAVPAEKQCVERTFWLLSTSRMTTSTTRWRAGRWLECCLDRDLQKGEGDGGANWREG